MSDQVKAEEMEVVVVAVELLLEEKYILKDLTFSKLSARLMLDREELQETTLNDTQANVLSLFLPTLLMQQTFHPQWLDQINFNNNSSIYNNNSNSNSFLVNLLSFLTFTSVNSNLNSKVLIHRNQTLRLIRVHLRSVVWLNLVLLCLDNAFSFLLLSLLNTILSYSTVATNSSVFRSSSITTITFLSCFLIFEHNTSFFFVFIYYAISSYSLFPFSFYYRLNILSIPYPIFFSCHCKQMKFSIFRVFLFRINMWDKICCLC